MRSFAGIKGLSYIGSLYRQPQNLAPNSSFVPIQIDWNTYFTLAGGSPANLGINVNLQSTGGPLAKAISKIVSVYIDNLGSNIPIYVYFPDSGFVVVAPPNTATWYPCITGQLLCTIFAEGLNASNVPLTRLFFTDVFVPPYADAEINQAVALWLASASITRGTTILNTNYGVPALGDQSQQINGTVTGLLNADQIIATGLFGTPQASGFVYLTGLTLTLWNITQSGAGNFLTLESTGAAGQLFNWPLNNWSTAGGQIAFPPIRPINLKLDATQTWRLRCHAANAASESLNLWLEMSYTINPN